jgi:hypothetical protein
MTKKWRSNSSIPNLVEFKKRLNEQLKLNDFIAADKSAIPPWVKFEFDDKDWAELNRHADLPDGARHELESAIYLYLVFCLRAGPTKQQNIKNEFKRLAKKADALSTAFDNLSAAAMNISNPILNKHKAAVADLRGWAAKMVQAWGRRHPNTDPSARDRLIRDAAMIYNGYAKTPFKDFPNREQFVFDLLEIAGVKKGEDAVKKVILACRKLENFSRRRNSE